MDGVRTKDGRDSDRPCRARTTDPALSCSPERPEAAATDRTILLVRVGSVPQRSRTGSSGHQRSSTVQRKRRSPASSSSNRDDASRQIRLWSRRSGRRRRGSRWAATGVRNDRGARPRTVEDHDRRSCHRRPLTWRFSRVFPGPQHTAIPCRNARYRSRTEEARGSNPLTSTPQQPWPRALAGRFHGPTHLPGGHPAISQVSTGYEGSFKLPLDGWDLPHISPEGTRAAVHVRLTSRSTVRLAM
jgi:hypothetical protein